MSLCKRLVLVISDAKSLFNMYLENFGIVVEAIVSVFDDPIYNICPVRGSVFVVYYGSDKKIHVKISCTTQHVQKSIINSLNGSTKYSSLSDMVIFDLCAPPTIYAAIKGIQHHGKVVAWKGDSVNIGSTICFDVFETSNMEGVLTLVS